MFEQYQGDRVALFGKDDRQKNPYAITARSTYADPLVTIGAEHRAGKGSRNDSNISVQLNYRLGESWQAQMVPLRWQQAVRWRVAVMIWWNVITRLCWVSETDVNPIGIAGSNDRKCLWKRSKWMHR